MVVQTRKRTAALERAAAQAEAAADSAATPPKRQKLPVRSRADELKKSGTKAGSLGSGLGGKLITFDDEDKASHETHSVLAPPASSVAGEDVTEDGSDDDAAPEAVSTTQGASDFKKSAQAAQEAARQIAATEKRKRQKRDTLLKKQAEERKKPEKTASAAAMLHDDDRFPPPLSVTNHPLVSAGGRRKRTDKKELPDRLPLELLTDSSGDDDADDEDNIKEEPRARGACGDGDSRTPRKQLIPAIEKSLSCHARGPRDRRVGSTLYRVAAKVDQRLAPKSVKNSMLRKDLLRTRNKTPVKARPGFLMNK